MPLPPPGFSWNEGAFAACFEQLGFGFDEVVHIFQDEEFDYLRMGPFDHEGESRYRAIGRLRWGLVVAVAYTMRGGLRHVIHARPASRSERRAFAAHHGQEE